MGATALDCVADDKLQVTTRAQLLLQGMPTLTIMNMVLKTFTALLFGPFVIYAAQARRQTYKGWQTLSLSNGIIEVQIAPDLGGRVIQCSLGSHDYLWVNPYLAGKVPPPSGLGAKGEWLNYGGDKLWPAPQGWNGPEQWPGPPDAILDGSPYEATVLEGRGQEVSVKLVSRKDPYTGIQFTRTITLPEGSSRVLFHAVMTNVDTKPRRWGIWSVTQLDASSRSGEGYNPDYRGYIPVNPQSRFPNGYVVLFGDKKNPQFRLDPAHNSLRIHYERKVGKVGLDSRAGWVANVDGTSGYVFVQVFHFAPGREYPEGSSVEYWTNGLGRIFAWRKEIEMSSSPSENPFVIESELLSPLESLQPGQSASFEYEWRVAQLGGSFPILNCNAAGCTAEAFACKRTSNGTLALSGRFGVFYSGVARLRILDADKNQLSETGPVPVSPDSPLVMQTDFPNVSAPASARLIELVIYDRQGRAVDTLARCAISKN